MIMVCTAVAQARRDPLEAHVDQVFAPWDKPDSPGAAVVIVKDGAILYKRGYGMANLEYDIPITPATVFHVASVSKQFTAFAVAMLVAQGKLSLDDDIRKYLPEVPDFGTTITLRHLVYHTSGLRDQWGLLALAGWRLDDVITTAHILKLVHHQKALNFEPGQEFLYCNTGYTLLALIVERVTGQPFRQYTDATMFQPLGMLHTHFHDDHEMLVKNRAYSYAPARSGGFILQALNYATVGATSLWTTVEDMARWLQNLEDGRVGGTAVLAQMQQSGVLKHGEKIPYAFGLAFGQYKGLKTVAHAGGDAGYRSYVLRFPDQHLAVVVLSNVSTMNPSRLAVQVADLYLADQLTATSTAEPTAPRVVKRDPALSEAYVGTYLLPSRLIVSLTKDNNRFMVQAAGQPTTALVPTSDTQFVVVEDTEPYFALHAAHLAFHPTEQGAVTGFTLHQYGQEIPATRVAPPTLSASQLAEFVGEYASDELGTTYTISLRRGQLVAQHRRHDDILLTPLAVDRFSGSQWWFQQVYFTRDNAQRVIGLQLTGGRNRNLRFDKKAQELDAAR
jgi:CubicO group peptidase (beta-lactamase class C family)